MMNKVRRSLVANATIRRFPHHGTVLELKDQKSHCNGTLRIATRSSPAEKTSKISEESIMIRIPPEGMEELPQIKEIIT